MTADQSDNVERSANERAMDIAFDALLNIRDGQVRSTSVRGYARRTVEAIDAVLEDHSGRRPSDGE